MACGGAASRPASGLTTRPAPPPGSQQLHALVGRAAWFGWDCAAQRAGCRIRQAGGRLSGKQKGRTWRPFRVSHQADAKTEFGGATRDRTADLLHAMQALSQLSYSPAIARGRMLRPLFGAVNTSCRPLCGRAGTPVSQHLRGCSRTASEPGWRSISPPTGPARGAFSGDRSSADQLLPALFAAIHSMAASMRASTRSRPISARVTSSPGEASPPVLATRSGRPTLPKPTPSSSTVA